MQFCCLLPIWWEYLTRPLQAFCIAISDITTTISCRWQTHATRCITVNVQVHAQCDKLATELSWQCFTSKVAYFQLSHLHFTYPTCIWHFCWGDPIWILPRFSATETESRAIMWRCLCGPTFSCFSRTPTYDRHLDRQTMTVNTFAGVARVKVVACHIGSLLHKHSYSLQLCCTVY